jgi:hypothetical protein
MIGGMDEHGLAKLKPGGRAGDFQQQRWSRQWQANEDYKLVRFFESGL